MDQSLVSVMKSIGKALQLDNDNNYQEAYIKYAECILSIVSNLLHNIKTDGGKVTVSKEVVRHIQLGQQCMDRLATLIQALVPVQNVAETRSSQNKRAVPGPNFQLAKRFSEPVPPLDPDTSPYAFSRKQGPTPMEVAYLRNQQIMSAYKSRLARMNRGSQATQLSLTVQRKMAENLAIAKAQEQALAKKMNERQNRLEEQAKRRFTAPMGMSEEEQEQRQIYKKILEYEQDAKWLAQWRQKLENSPEDPIVINQLIQEILRCSDHPLTQLLKKYQYKIYERLYPLVCNKMKQLKDITVPLPTYLYPVDEDGKSPLAVGIKEEPGGEDSTGRETEQHDADGKNDEDNSGESDGAVDGSSSQRPDSVNTGDKDSDEKGDNEYSDEKGDENDGKDNKTEMKYEDMHGKSLPTVISECSMDSTENEREVAKIIKEVEDSAAQDDTNDDDIDESSLQDMDEIVEQSKDNVKSATAKGNKLEKQLTIENERAASVIRRISEYERYNEENMDDLFDEDEDEDDSVLIEDDKPESEQGNGVPSDDLSSDIAPSEGHTSLPSVGSIPRSQSMDYGPTSLPSYPSSDTNSMKSSRSVDSISDKTLFKMSEEAYRRHLSGISQDVHSYLEKLLLMFTIAYENLDSPTGRDQCYASLEEPFFKPIWKYILALFRLANKAKETSLAYKMTIKQNCEPKDYYVIQKLWLGSADDENWLPYNKAIVELMKVKEYYTMLSKLECVVRACREVCTCVEDYYASREVDSGKKTPSVGADDLLPILSYIVVKTKLPQIVSECQAMAEFIHEGYIMGEEGYCLTSLQTAVNYLTT